jgi:hypothetical protein
MYFFTAVLLSSFFAKIALKLLGKHDETPNSVQIEEYISLPFLFIGCVGMYGYVYRITFFEPWFWQLYMAIALGHLIICFWLPKLRWMRSILSSKSFIVTNSVGLLISLPFYFIVFSYAF